jgi:hydrogenase maturation protein HypF
VATQQIRKGVNCPRASSMGRLFDAAAALAGVRTVSHFEGHAPMELEALAGKGAGMDFPTMAVRELADREVLDPRPLLVEVSRARRRGEATALVAAGFHDAVVRSAVDASLRLASRWSVNTVALGGGVFQNRRILSGIAAGLRLAGLEVLLPRRLGPNDGAVSYGQAAVAAARLAGLPSGISEAKAAHAGAPAPPAIQHGEA